MISTVSFEDEVRRLDAIGTKSGWTYSATKGAYRSAKTGRFLSQEEVLELTRQVVTNSRLEVQSLTTDFLQGVMRLSEWQRAVAQIVKEAHLAQYILGRGGVKNVVPEDYLEVARNLKIQYGYLSAFASEIASGKLSAQMIRARADLYVNATIGSYWLGKNKSEVKNRQPTMMRRTLSIAENCPDCIRYAAIGWTTIGSLPMPTVNCQCGANCKCSVSYR